MKYLLYLLLFSFSIVAMQPFPKPEELNVRIRFVKTERGIEGAFIINKTPHCHLARFRYIYEENLDGQFIQLPVNILELPSLNYIVTFFAIKK